MPGVNTPADNPLQRALTLCRSEMLAVNECIYAHLQSDVTMIPAVGNYIVHSGGKRLRPLLTILVARLFNYGGERHIPLSVVVEFVHTASLLHDDVVDSADQRRGNPSANGVWGNQASVLVGDFLFSRSFEIMVRDGDMAILRLMSQVTGALAEGEVLQLARTFHLEMDEAQCLEVIERKTAVLFAAAAEIGARVAGCDDAAIRRLSDYGMCLGVAFQLMDDALDYLVSSVEAGKPVGHDLEEGKITLPLIRAMAIDAELATRVGEIAERGSYAEGDREWVRNRVATAGGIEFCMQRAADYAERAKSLLADAGDPALRALLCELADFSARRSF